jgi:hypothetical protein
MHAERGVDRRQTQNQPTQTELDVDGRTRLRRAKGLRESEEIGVESDRSLDVANVKIDLRIAKQARQPFVLWLRHTL